MAGLAICAAGVIVPAQNDLEALQAQLHQLQAEEGQAYARLKAHADFMDQVDRADPALTRRLAAAQLNLVPEEDTPILLASSKCAPVTQWIESTIDSDIRPAKPQPISTLSRWADGPHRLFFFGAGVMAVFVGVVLSPAPGRRTRRMLASDELLSFDDAANHIDCDELVAIEVSQPDEGPTCAEIETGQRDEDAFGSSLNVSAAAHQLNAVTAALPIVETEPTPFNLKELEQVVAGSTPPEDELLCDEVDELGLEIITTPLMDSAFGVGMPADESVSSDPDPQEESGESRPERPLREAAD